MIRFGPEGTKLVRCPRCRTVRIRKSERPDPWLVFPLSRFVIRIRCLDCGLESLRFGLFGEEKSSEPRKKAA